MIYFRYLRIFYVHGMQARLVEEEEPSLEVGTMRILETCEKVNHGKMIFSEWTGPVATNLEKEWEEVL